MSNDISEIDWISIFLYLSLSAMGLVNIFSATNSFNIESSETILSPFNKQLIFTGISLILIVGLLLLKSKFYESLSNILYVTGIALLLGVLIFGKKISGATSWYSIAGFSFQPSEFAKIGTALLFSKFLGQVQVNIKRTQDLLLSISIIGIPFFLVALQPDAGTMLVFAMLSIILFGEGINKLYFFIICLLVITFPITLKFGISLTILMTTGLSAIIIIWVVKKSKIQHNNRIKLISYILLCFLGISLVSIGTNFIYTNVLKPHHQNRFKLWLNLESDVSTAKEIKKTIGYNTYQSEKAISSGGLEGKGFLEGTRTKGNFIPEQHTDYIFTTVGEEWGFLGSLVIVTLFSMLIVRIIYKSSRQKQSFARNYGYCVSIILGTHYIINIGMVMGLLPTVGIPLPYFSYGGSAFIGFSVLLFIYIRLSSQKTNEWLTSESKVLKS